MSPGRGYYNGIIDTLNRYKGIIGSGKHIGR